jgi:hypothetical protein
MSSMAREGIGGGTSALAAMSHMVLGRTTYQNQANQ